ncbi:MAG: S41 family peptidase [bacterium]
MQTKESRWLGGAACALITLLCSGAPASAQAFDRAAWQQDYTVLKTALEKRYSNLAWFASPEGGIDLPALNRRTLSALQSATSDEDGNSALLAFVRGFHDGHFSQLPTLTPATTVGAAPATPEYSRQDAATGCAALNFAPYDRPIFSLPFESLPGFRLIADGIGTPFRAGILADTAKSRSIGIVRIASFEENSDQGLCIKAWARDDMWGLRGKLLRVPLRKAVEHDWYEALAGVLRTFQAAGVAGVLVDVGNNSGGDDSGDITARLFTARPVHSAALWMTQDSATSAAYFDEELDALRTARQLDSTSQLAGSAQAAFLLQKGQLTQATCGMDWVWQTRRPWSGTTCRRLVAAGSAGGPLSYLSPDSIRNVNVARQLHWPAVVAPLWGTWRGPLYVLTDNKTYSSAEMFAAVLQNNGAAKTVGIRTGGDGCGFMNNPDPVVLPHSRLRFRVPNCVRMRADGTDEVAGVKPDIPVLPMDGENGRVRAMRVFTEVTADLKRPSQGPSEQLH